MRLTVRLFAGLKERAGAPTLDIELTEPATVADVIAAVPLGLPPRSFIVAVNREYAAPEEAVRDGDEVALVPPVSGGAGEAGRRADERAASPPSGATADLVRAAYLTSEPLDLAELAARVRDARAGAVVTFEGVTRSVEWLDYEAYAEMAEPMLRQIAAEEAARHGLVAVAVAHRVGRVPLSEPSVLVAAAAPHRGAAFAGARAIIDRLKAQAPIFKREEEGPWIEGTLPSPDGLKEERDGDALRGE